jgi:hypothetical protein
VRWRLVVGGPGMAEDLIQCTTSDGAEIDPARRLFMHFERLLPWIWPPTPMPASSRSLLP